MSSFNQKKQNEYQINDNSYDILILSTYDWCNTAYRYKKSLQLLGYSVELIKLLKNKYNWYEENNISLYEKNNIYFKTESTPYYYSILNNDYLKEMILKSKVIYLHAETYIEIINFDYRHKYIISGVSGHPYRRKPKEYCNLFNQFTDKTLIQCPDLLNLGMKNESLVYYGVDTDIIKYNPLNKLKQYPKLIIGHFSSNPSTKGSDVILSAIKHICKLFPDKYEYIGYNSLKANHLPWKDNIKRMSNCDIYIETCKPYLNKYNSFNEYNNTKFGEWGNTCLEASAAGCIVITNTLTKELYLKEYTDDYPLLIALNKDDIIKHLTTISKMSKTEIITLQEKFRNWALNTHSLLKTGERFSNKLLKDYLNNFEENKIIANYKPFNKLDIQIKNVFSYHFISLFYMNNENNSSCNFELSNVNNTELLITDFNNIIVNYSLDKQHYINNIGSNIVINISNNENVYNININFLKYSLENNFLIYIIFKNDKNSKIYLGSNFSNNIITNNSPNKLFLLNNNNNIIIRNNTYNDNNDYKILKSNLENIFLNKQYFVNYMTNNNINYLFKDNDEKIMYYLHLNIFSKYTERKYYINNFNKFNDFFEIQFRLNNNCKLLIITQDDWSNTAYRFNKSLNLIGYNSVLIKLNSHRFNYPEQGIIYKCKKNTLTTYPKRINIINNSSFLKNIIYGINNNILLHSSTSIYINNKPIYKLYKSHKYLVSHGGTSFRENTKLVDYYFKKITNKYIIQCPDLLGYTNVSEQLIYYPLDCNYIKPNYETNDILTIGHFPSSCNTKGTKNILNVINKLENDKDLRSMFKYIGIKENKDSKRVSWNDNLSRMKKCDIIIEGLNLKINDKIYGEWGNTCLEAAALGCIVCTHHLKLNDYIKYYNTKPSIQICNDINTLYITLVKLIKMDKNDLLVLKKESRKWVEDYHSLEKTGERLEAFIEK